MSNREMFKPRKRIKPIELIRFRVKNNLGFSLIEVIIGIVIFTTMILAIFRLFAFSTMQNRHTNDLDNLYSIAERSMEYIKNNDDNYLIIESPNYQELTGYTSDPETQSKYTVIYKARKIEIPNPIGEPTPDVSGAITNAINYTVEVEVYFSKDKLQLESLGPDSKVNFAQSKNIPIVSLNSQVIQFEQ